MVPPIFTLAGPVNGDALRAATFEVPPGGGVGLLLSFLSHDAIKIEPDSNTTKPIEVSNGFFMRINFSVLYKATVIATVSISVP